MGIFRNVIALIQLVNCYCCKVPLMPEIKILIAQDSDHLCMDINHSGKTQLASFLENKVQDMKHSIEYFRHS